MKSATFKRDACGHWHVTLVVAFAMPDVPLPFPRSENLVGLDAGLGSFLALSNGEKIEAPKFYRKSQKRLRRAQRVLSRRKPGSNRRGKAKNRVACVHQQTANQRQDFLHKQSTDLINRFDGICIEDLYIKGACEDRSWPKRSSTQPMANSGACWNTRRYGTASIWLPWDGSILPPRRAAHAQRDQQQPHAGGPPVDLSRMYGCA